MVGLCLIAVFAVSAVGAGSAMAKDPYTVNTWGQYKYCDYSGEGHLGELENCFAGITAGGSKGGFFEYGKVKVKLNKSITLQGTFKGEENHIEVSPAINGGETLEAPELKVTGGISVLSKQVQQEAKWPTALSESWKEAKKNKESAVFAKIEMAGNECFEVAGCLDTENILFEEGVAFRLPLKVKITSPWLEKLASGPCYIASDANPIHINLTTEGAGSAGSLTFNEEFSQIMLGDTKLVDFGWHIPKVSGANGCGGEYEEYVDKALNIALEVEYPEGGEVAQRKGIVVLQGNLHNALIEAVKKAGVESGELP
jgi:hypothetical protein